jgi:DNA-binding CsgD family transcriptional regulator
MSVTSIDHEPTTPSVPDGCMATLDRGLRIVTADAALRDALAGRPGADVCGTPFTDHLHQSVRTVVGRRLERLVTGQDAGFREPCAALVSGGSVLYGELHASAFSRDAGGVQSVVVTLRPSGPARSETRGPARTLTDIDVKILEGVAAGASTLQLAADLYLSRGGIEYHITSLLRRMSVKNRPALVSKAYSMGVFEMGEWPPQVASEG